MHGAEYFLDANGKPLEEELELTLRADGRYVVRYVSPFGDEEYGAGRYTYRPGAEFSLTYENGKDYVGIAKLDADHLQLQTTFIDSIARIDFLIKKTPARDSFFYDLKRMKLKD